METKHTNRSEISPLASPKSALKTAHGTVSVVGLGYVGLPLALLARSRGYKITGIDTDPKKRSAIQTGAVPDLESNFLEELQRDPLVPSEEFSEIQKTDLIVICVPTPVDHSHNPNLTPLKSAVESVGAYLRSGHVVIIESTVHPGTCEEIVIPILEKKSGLRAGKDFGVAHCPERINPGDRYWPISRIPRVIGAINSDSLEKGAAFYRSILSALVYEMESLREAEAVKVVENAFRDINIAFVNELAMSFSKLNIDVLNVLEGAATKPFGFMLHSPGCGVGGHCIPVDPYYLIRYAKTNGFSHEFLSLARSINERMPAFTVEVLEKALEKKGKKLRSATVALLGLSYKPNVSDLRESPSFEIERFLRKRRARVNTFDPYALPHSTARTLPQALKGADAAIVATAHREFAALSPETFAKYRISTVIDGRNCLPKAAFLKAGIDYRGIGR